jgi:hypothetical protein
MTTYNVHVYSIAIELLPLVYLLDRLALTFQPPLYNASIHVP